MLTQLWAIARGNDCRGDKSWVSVGKLFGTYLPADVVGPDRMYKLQLLKDEAKHNKGGRTELIGTARHKDPLLCSVNAIATMLILRFGSGANR